MKKIIILVMMIVSLLTITACDKKANKEDLGLKENITVITPNGIPYIALGGLINTENLTIEAVNGPENLKGALTSNSYDMVVAPVNLGAQLYAKGASKYQLAAVITQNNAYVVTTEANKLESVDDLAGQKVFAFGQTGIPGSLLKKIYMDNEALNIEDVDYTLASSKAVFSTYFGNDEAISQNHYALMSEPEVTSLKEKTKVKVIDLCEVLKMNAPQACLFINPENTKMAEIQKVLTMIENNIMKLNSDTTAYVDQIIDLDRNFTAVGKDILVKSLPSCDVVYKTSTQEMKQEVTKVLELLGLGAPADAFYYQK